VDFGQIGLRILRFAIRRVVWWLRLWKLGEGGLVHCTNAGTYTIWVSDDGAQEPAATRIIRQEGVGCPDDVAIATTNRCRGLSPTC